MRAICCPEPRRSHLTVLTMPIRNLSPKQRNDIDTLPPALAAKAVEFIFHPAEYVHNDHLRNDPASPNVATISFLLQNKRSRTRISKALAGVYGLDAKVDFNYKNPLWLLALLTPDDIRQVARIATLSSHNVAARGYKQPADIKKIAQLVGSDGYKFALADAESLDSLSISINQFLLMLETDAIALIHEWLDYLPAEVTTRVQLKFPVKFSANKNPSASGLGALVLAAGKFAPACIGYVAGESSVSSIRSA